MSTIYALPAGNTITVSISDGSCHISQVQDSSIGAIVTSSKTFGPYSIARDFVVSGGSNTVTISPVTQSPAALLTSGDGAPVDAARATLNVNPTGDDNGLTFTAVEYGAIGNSIKIQYTDPSANDAALAVSVFNRNITVSLATNGGGTITSTAALVLAAIEASSAASDLVTVAIMTSDSGTGDDGSGVVTAMALTAMASGAGTGIGTALPGCIYIDTTGGDVYRNSGTLLVPAWAQLAEVA